MAQDTLPTILAVPETAAPARRRPDLLHRLFEARVEEEPGREALVWGKDRLSYGELGRRAALTAAADSVGHGGDHPVPNALERAAEMDAAEVLVVLARARRGGEARRDHDLARILHSGRSISRAGPSPAREQTSRVTIPSSPTRIAA